MNVDRYAGVYVLPHLTVTAEIEGEPTFRVNAKSWEEEQRLLADLRLTNSITVAAASLEELK
jgi:hypothetical protein